MLLKENLLCILEGKEDIASLDFKDWLFSDDAFGKNAQIDNIKKWIRYMAVDYGDADIVLKKGKILEKLNWNTQWIDCIYSFKTYFNAFLRFYLNGKKETYGYILDHYDEIFSQSKKKQFAKEREINLQLLISLFNELNSFALYTHTIGNYMPCPDGDYNSIKGFYGYKYFQDRLDLLYSELLCPKHLDYQKLNEEKRASYKKWLDDNKTILHIENLLKNDKLNYLCKSKQNGCYHIYIMNDKEDLKNFLNYLKEINLLIKNRGLTIEKELKENLLEKRN